MKQNLKTFVVQLSLFLVIQSLLVFSLYKILPSYVYKFDDGVALSAFGGFVEMAVLLLGYLLFLSVTGRFIYALLITNILYLFIIISGILKIEFLNAPVVLYDLYQIDDLLLNINVLNFQIIGVLIIVLVSIIYLFYKGITSKSNHQYRLITFAALLCCAFFGSITVTPAKALFKKHKIKYKWNSDIIAKTQKHGFLTVFLESLYFSTQLQEPDKYTKKQAVSWLKEFDELSLPEAQKDSTNFVPDNVIILMVESFQDPVDLPWKTEQELLPAYKSMQKTGFPSHLISPVFGGKSVNAEFELLTGFSHIFLPQGAIPYKDFVHQKIPSLAWQMKNNGFTTNVIQVVKMLGYGYETIYDYLGFDNKYSLNSKSPNIVLDPTGRYGSSEAIAQQMIELLEQQEKSFIFAFPNSTHAPWKISDYPNNNISLNNNNLSKSEANEVIAYYNALNHIDILFSKLYQWSEMNQNEKTLIFIVGDHKPALKAWGHNKISRIEQNRVPYLIWANYPLDISGLTSGYSSMNLIGGNLLELAKINLTGFFKFHAVLRDYYQIFTFELIEKISETKLSADIELFKVYQSLQYYFLSK